MIVVYLLMTLPLVAWGAQRALQQSANSPLDWVSQDFAPRHDFDQFCRVFGTADTVILSWPGCTLDDPRLDRLTAALRTAPAFTENDRPLFQNVTSGREQIGALTRPPISLSRAEAVGRLTGSLIGPDGQTTCVVIGFTEQALRQRSSLVPLIQAAATRHCGVPRDSQRLAGPIMDGYQVDVATRSTMNFLAPLSAALVLVLCYLCLGSAGGALLVFLLSLFCQAVTLAIVHFDGGTMTALMAVLAPLIQVLAIAGGIHFVNYYFDARASLGDHGGALTRAFHLAWLPCLLSAATTAIGLASLGVSGLVAVREFGLYAAVGVVLTAAILLTLIPGFGQWFPLAPPRGIDAGRSSMFWDVLATWIKRSAGWISGAALVLMLVLGIGVSRLNASVRIETLFASDSRLIQDYNWLEDHVGKLVPIEVVVTLPPESASTLEPITLLRRIDEKLRAIDQVGAVVSVLTYLPPPPPGQDPIRGRGQRELARSLGERSNHVAVEPDGTERWRVTGLVSALGANDYVQIMQSVEDAVTVGGGVAVQVSGLMPLVHEIQQRLLGDLFRSFLTAFGLIALVMTIVQAGVLPGLLAMIPNVFPALTLFGILGWIGRPLDIGTIMTASVAMGIGVDDTLHFLTFYQRALQSGATRADAVRSAYHHCGRAMIQTTTICGCGLGLFALSDFVPTQGFAWMSVLLLSAALVGDLIILPAILIGPLGRATEIAPVNRPAGPVQRIAVMMLRRSLEF
ncbi:efflux RND transporter permease subunit [Rhodopirellula sp. JC639]|uniref:efflux RND transporter permease subunit n=1 Tax=Stieleria mannarensis TaxID=2755585 RepID=UPI0015FFEEE2|nr:MMPL family transporter [Rhodopirellula sp. JC639]